MLTLRNVSASIVFVSAGAIFAACSSDGSSSAHGADGSVDGAVLGVGGAAQSGGGGQSATGGAVGTGGVGGQPAQGGVTGGGGQPGSGGAAAAGGAGSTVDAGDSGQTYLGPSVGTAKQFAALAYSAVTTANASTIVGSIGVSAMATSTITGFDGPAYKKYGNDSLAPNAGLTGTAQRDVTALVGNIDPRACDVDLTNVVGGLTGDVTLHPGVTCMNSPSADILLNGHVYLDAGGNRDAFFIIRGKKAMTVADGAQVVLMNGAQACGTFWRISTAVTIGKTVQFQGTIIAGTAITMNTATTLDGRALAQTAGIHLDANTITTPSDAECPHVQ